MSGFTELGGEIPTILLKTEDQFSSKPVICKGKKKGKTVPPDSFKMKSYEG